MAETVCFTVFTGGVVGVGQTSHEDDASFLTQTLNSHSHTRGRAAVDHECAVFFDHRLGRCACGVRFGLRVAGDELDFFAEDAVTLQRLRREGVQATAVAFAVQMLNSQLLRQQFIRAFIGVWAGLRDVEAQRDSAAGWGVGVGVARGP